jgi:hypothetical protein
MLTRVLATVLALVAVAVGVLGAARALRPRGAARLRYAVRRVVAAILALAALARLGVLGAPRTLGPRSAARLRVLHLLRAASDQGEGRAPFSVAALW